MWSIHDVKYKSRVLYVINLWYKIIWPLEEDRSGSPPPQKGRRTPFEKARLELLLLLKMCPEIYKNAYQIQFQYLSQGKIYSYLQHIYKCKSNWNSNVERKRKTYIVTCSTYKNVNQIAIPILESRRRKIYTIL